MKKILGYILLLPSIFLAGVGASRIAHDVITLHPSVFFGMFVLATTLTGLILINSSELSEND